MKLLITFLEEDCINWMRLTKNVEEATHEKVMVDDGSV